MPRTCATCPTVISPNSKGWCRPCSAKRLNSDPDVAAKRRAGQLEFFGRPETKAALAARIGAHVANMSPEERERRRERGRVVAATVLHSPENKAKANSAEAKARAGRARTDTVLADIPPAYRDRYRFLKNTKLIRAAEAKALVLEEVAVDERRRLAAMTPLERQLERVRAGASVVTVRPMPSRSHDFTLGGVATGML